MRGLGWICFLLIILILAVTNLTTEEYVARFSAKAAAQGSDPLIKGLAGLLTRPVVESATRAHNYVVLTFFETGMDGEAMIVLGVLENFITISQPPPR